MKFYGNVAFQQNSLVRHYTTATLPVSGLEGDMVYVNDHLYVAIDNTPTWVEVTNLTDFYVHTQAESSDTWTVTHNLNTSDVIVDVYEGTSKIIPDSIVITSVNVVTLTFNTAITGKAVVVTGNSNGVAAASSGGFTWSVKTANYTASNNDGVVADTSGGAWTLTLPASPSAGDKVAITYEPGVSSNSLTIGRNGEKIMGLVEDMTVSTADLSFTLVYIDSTYGWRIV